MTTTATPSDPERHLDGTVVQLGGGRSAGAAAVVVAVILGIVVWVGASGRPPATPALPSSEPGQVAQGSAEASDAIPTPTSNPVPAPPNDSFAISVQVGRQDFIGYLDELQPGHLSGQVRIALPLVAPSDTGSLAFHQLSASWAPGQRWRIGRWPMNLEPLGTVSNRLELVVNTSVPAEPRDGNVPRPTRDGFWIRAGIRTATAEAATVVIDVRVGPDQQLIGQSDGLFAPDPISPDSPVVVARPASEDYPRDRGLYNRCRWDVAPYSGKPIPGTDEADC